jgi:hypothetical protein
MKPDDELMLEVVGKLVYKKTVGDNTWQADTVKDWFEPNDQDRVEDVIRRLVRDTDAPVADHDGGNIQLTSIQDTKVWYARECLRTRGQDLWWIEPGGCGK